MTRSIGDRLCKDIGVIALPDVRSYSLERDSMILLASDGVYDVITN
jgi:serine/threonine protein phosphatase PrpC